MSLVKHLLKYNEIYEICMLCAKYFISSQYSTIVLFDDSQWSKMIFAARMVLLLTMLTRQILVILFFSSFKWQEKVVFGDLWCMFGTYGGMKYSLTSLIILYCIYIL